MRLLNFDNINFEPPADDIISDFYNEFSTDLHKKAMQLKAVNERMFLIQEVTPYGKKAILAFLNNQKFRNMYGANPRIYYYEIMYLVINFGIAVADKWYKEFPKLDRYVDDLIKNGPEKDAYTVLSENFSKKIYYKQGHPLFQNIYSVWAEMIHPYWELPSPQLQIYEALLACFHLGATMVINNYGYWTKYAWKQIKL
jgi:hypothetical protein